MRRWMVSAVVVGSIVAVPLTVAAVTLHNGSPLDHQRAKTQVRAASTSSTRWITVPDLHNLDVCAVGEVSATLSVNVTGAPSEFRVLVDGGPLMVPHRVHFNPRNGTTSFSFTFVIHVTTFEGSDGHLFDVQWRAPNGGVTTLRSGNVNLLFHVGNC